MTVLKRMVVALSEPWKIVVHPKLRFISKYLPDKFYIRCLYHSSVGKKLNLKDPKSFNEKLQWLKLHDRKPIYTTMVDKYAAKEYVASVIGEEHIIPTLGVWDRFDDIDFEKLPNQFVLKCTHDSAGLVICKDKTTFCVEKAKEKIELCLKRNYFYSGREWPYKQVKPRIIAEQYMEDKNLQELRDYKFFCFNGIVKCFKVDFDRFVEHHANYYDREKNLLRFGEKECPPKFSEVIDIPSNVDQMIDFAEKLSNGIPFLRADFYNVDESVYFGELTFYPASGFGPFSPEEFDFIMGRWLSLPEKSGGGYIFITQDIFVRLEKREELIDYKFYCFDGEPKFLYVAVAGFIDGERHDKLTYLDLNWDRTLFGRSDHQLLPFDVRKPNHLDEMIDIARKLSTDIPFVRVDLYNINDKVYFSELTFYPGSGLGLFSPETAEMEIGSWIDLSKV